MSPWLRRKPPKSVPPLPVREAYARWAPGYAAQAHNPLMALEQAAMFELLPPVEGKRVLDLACGSGRYLAALADRQPASLIGLDVSPEMLARAAETNRRLVCGDLLRLPLQTETVDVIVCGLAVGHVPDLGAALAEMARVLTPGGSVVYSDFHPLMALAGMRRTFQGQDGRQYEVEHHTHLYADHHAACAAAGLRLDGLREPRLTIEHPWRGKPAALVVLARKP